MSEIYCPYCEEVNILEGEDYPENDGDSTEIDCVHCEETFEAWMCVSVDFSVRCADGMHKLEDKYPNDHKLGGYLWCTNIGCDHLVKKE